MQFVPPKQFGGTNAILRQEDSIPIEENFYICCQ